MSFLERKKPGFLDRKALAQQERRIAESERRRAESVEDEPEALRAFHERNKAEMERRKNATDSECWVALVFPTRSDKDKFIAEFGLLDKPMIRGTPGDKYVDGNALASALRKRST
jgi:hypothetical protein